jgi:hypothetical protein
MGRIGKISSIKKEYDRNNGSLEASLAANGYSRFPGTGVRFVPFREPNGEYRTGLNPDATYLKKLQRISPESYALEVERITKLKERLEGETGLNLGPRSEYYTQIFNDRVTIKASIIRVKEGDNVFDLEDPFQAITYEWLRVHPLIASSYQAYERGEYPANTQFFVNDESIEEELKYKRKTLVNRAISTLENLSLEKRRKVARLLGLPVSDNSKEQFVYNLLDTFIKQSEIKTGDFKGGNPVDLFNKFAQMDDKLVTTKDLVDQAIKHSIYRVTKGARITEGGQEIAKSKEDLVDFLLDDKNQDDLLALQEKLKTKKSVLLA